MYFNLEVIKRKKSHRYGYIVMYRTNSLPDTRTVMLPSGHSIL